MRLLRLPARHLTLLLLSFTALRGGGFSHKAHAPLKLACTHCHTTAATSERAGFPAAAVCATCHTAEPKTFQASRVYRLKDFVFFSHGRHHQAKVACDACHGKVYQQDIVRKVLASTTMKFCVDCHKASKAVTTCTACHELSQ